MFKLIKYFRNLVILLIIFAVFWHWATRTNVTPQTKFQYGVTFSAQEARDLGLDWQAVYLAMLDDLRVKKIRLAAYWDIVEPTPGQDDWRELDWQFAEAEKRDTELILAVGGRLPRWPECHFPDWVKALPVSRRETLTLDYISRVVERYKTRKNLVAWQVENEPFLSKFGECPQLNPDFLDREIALVKSLDKRSIVVTDSGELSIWGPAARRADIFGTTLYRDTYSQTLRSYIHYPITPNFFRIKRNLVSLFAEPKQWLVIELQTEPWAKNSFQDVSQAERDRTMSPAKFSEMLSFAKQTGFDTFYLWGVEWWYWEKERQNRPFFWNEARKIYSNQ
jgi:hypothetical protein